MTVSSPPPEVAVARKRSARLPLPEFDGMDVRAMALRIDKAGDGLSDALDVEPQSLTIGDRCFIILEAEVTQVNHARISAVSEDLVRRVTASTQRVAFVPETDAKLLLDAEIERLRLVKEEKAGVTRLPDPEEGEPPAGDG